jgi:predicted nucleic acid-binding protein
VSPSYDGHIYLFDTSVWEHTEHPLIASDWAAALGNDQLAVSPVVAFEVLYTARNQADFEVLEGELDALRQVPLTRGVVRDARDALHTLSATNRHRMPFQDAASAAHKHGVFCTMTATSTRSAKCSISRVAGSLRQGRCRGPVGWMAC